VKDNECWRSTIFHSMVQLNALLLPLLSPSALRHHRLHLHLYQCVLHLVKLPFALRYRRRFHHVHDPLLLHVSSLLVRCLSYLIHQRFAPLTRIPFALRHSHHHLHQYLLLPLLRVSLFTFSHHRLQTRLQFARIRIYPHVHNVNQINLATPLRETTKVKKRNR
jgi:hypothetical protein